MGAQGAGGRRRRSDAAVSPVIGMILILAISVLGIVAVTNWGMPAILQMQANVEVRSVLNEFSGLDASMQKLVAGTTGQTTLKWQPSISLGAVDVNSTGDRWLVTDDVQPGVTVNWSGLATRGLSSFTVKVTGTVPSPTLFHAWQWLDGAPTEVIVNQDSGTSCTPFSASLTGTQSFYLHANTTGSCPLLSLTNAVFSFSLRQEPVGGAPVTYADAFLVDTGWVHWNSVTGDANGAQVFHSNGAVYSGVYGALVAQTPLPIAPPRNFTNSTGVQSTSLFARFVKFNGTASFSGLGGGADRPSVYLDFVGSYTLGTEDNVTAVSVYDWGILQNASYAALTSSVAGYRFQQVSDTLNGVTETFVRDQEGAVPFRFAAAYSDISVEG